MKRLTAIFFIVLFLFNLAGYRILFFYVQQQSDARYEQFLDNSQYNESDLITIKIDLHLPYQTERSEFERVDGEINLNGKLYRYVKRKVSEGQLVLMCLPDHEKMKLQSASQDFFKISNSLADDQQSKKTTGKSGIIKNLQTEYDQLRQEFNNTSVFPNLIHYIRNTESYVVSIFHDSPEQPPEMA